MSGLEPFIAPTLVAGFNVCRSLLKKYKKKRKATENDVDSLDTVLRKGRKEIEQNYWNRYADQQGKRFAEGDG
jgi:hypothetical protein